MRMRRCDTCMRHHGVDMSDWKNKQKMFIYLLLVAALAISLCLNCVLLFTLFTRTDSVTLRNIGAFIMGNKLTYTFVIYRTETMWKEAATARQVLSNLDKVRQCEVHILVVRRLACLIPMLFNQMNATFVEHINLAHKNDDILADDARASLSAIQSFKVMVLNIKKITKKSV